MTVRVVVVGDVMLDRDIEGDVRRVTPDAPVPVVEIGEVRERAGGAGLAATLLARPGIEVSLVTALADDEPAKRLLNLLSERLPVTGVLTSSGTRCKTRVRSAGQSLLRMDVGASVDDNESCEASALEVALEEADAILVSDYGGGVVGHPVVREVLSGWASRRPMIWDPHPRGATPVPGVTVVTPNRAEALHFAVGSPKELDRLAVALQELWRARSVAVTDGAAGVFAAAGDGAAWFTPAPFKHQGDTCGAGDSFAGTVAAEVAAGATTRDAVEAAV